MRISKIRTYWIAILSVLAMLVSSIASVSAMTMMEMQPQQHHSMSGCNTEMMVEHPHAMYMPTADQVTPECGADNAMSHDCCPATCFSAFAFLTTDSQSPQHLTQLALINADQRIASIERPRSLYRPPIA